MSVKQDLNAYQQSIVDELRITRNRVRQLIGPRHWQTDGEHKETVLREVLRSHLPESVRVGTGFVCYPTPVERDVYPSRRGQYEEPLTTPSSGQLDILITDKRKPTLLKEGDVAFVTADAVQAIIEVKTGLRKGRSEQGLERVLYDLASEAESIRYEAQEAGFCWAGLFVFEKRRIDDLYLLRTLQKVTKKNVYRAVNCVALGAHIFVRFWHTQVAIELMGGPFWRSYRLENLAPTYFIGNMVTWLSRGIPQDARRAWFPLNSKEPFGLNTMPLRE
jgi:hypothetical protein